MTEHHVSVESASIQLSDRMSLHPRGLSGIVRVDGGIEPVLAQTDLMASLMAEGLKPGPTIGLPPAVGMGTGTRDLAGADTRRQPTQLQVDVDPGQSCVLLVQDENGAVNWVVPDGRSSGPGEAGSRDLHGTLFFTLDLAPGGPRIDPGIASETRGLLGGISTKVQALFFSATDAVLGPIVRGFARKWEAKYRPAFSRAFDADNYRTGDPSFARLTQAQWAALGQGPALLFVHGTFSTSAAFRGLEPAVMGHLGQAYSGRTFAFNHPTMASDPTENAAAFLGGVPDGVTLEIDIVCHSRGGLVARQIEAMGRAAGNVKVRRIVFVAATNAGTTLADADHMVDFISRYTTIAKFIPEGTAKTVVDAVVLAVKVLGHGLLNDLEGLAAMDPTGRYMKEINVAGPASAAYWAVSSNFEPKQGTPFWSLRRVEDATADRIFDDVQNDLVVPRDGVFTKNGAAGFPIDSGHCLVYGPDDGIVHTEFFDDARTGAQLARWLVADVDADVSRGLSSGAAPADIARVLDRMRDQLLLELGQWPSGGRALAGARDLDLDPAELDRLRPHVVSLSEGRFEAGSGRYTTTPQDVDAIVHEHLPAFAAALPPGEPLRVVVWAHGGLIGEKDGLRIALKHVDWWKKNGVYPVFFVWETGFFDALRAILEQVRAKLPGGRDLFDYTTDPLLEVGARALGGVKIWGAMKRNAELCSAADGGARYVARQLAQWVGGIDNGSGPSIDGHAVEFHGVGHSAGAIFHSWFLPAAREEGLPTFRTLQLLAPAITVDEFDQRLAPAIGSGAAAENAVVFTMKRDYEAADNCAQVYQKSLLYLIFHALEPKSKTPILGLEESLRADPVASRLFGLLGTTGAPGRVVWSVTKATSGASASAAVHHGDFDDDGLTMGSVAANVLREPNARLPYPGSLGTDRAVAGDWPQSNDWLPPVASFGLVAPAMLSQPSPQPSRPAAAPWAPPMPAGGSATHGATPTPWSGQSSSGRPSTGGRRLALCIGIDAYDAPNTLRGCVADARDWKAAFESLRFEVAPLLLDRQATREAMIAAITNLVAAGGPGDVLALHYSGHGTQVTDVDGDETDGLDEALVPCDFTDGAFLIDDDLRKIFNGLAEGVSLTCFIDCCHSATITRMLGRNADPSLSKEGVLSRYLKDQDGAWEDWMRAHVRFRQRELYSPSLKTNPSPVVDQNAIRWINFSACDATEVAYESDGHGAFTTKATALLRNVAGSRTNRDFQDAIIASFGSKRRQTPQLDCPDDSRFAPFLQSLR